MNKHRHPKEFVDGSLSEAEINTEIAKLAELPSAVFETRRISAAKKLHMRAHVLDRLVKVERVKSGSGDIDFLAHWTVKPWPEPVDGATLLDSLRKHFLRHVVLPKWADVAVSLWVLHTWVFDCFDVTPYLAVTSPTRRCGKTVLLTLLYWLSNRGKKNDSMSQAAIYRSVEREKPTLLLDETSWVTDSKDDRQGILCGGFERNGYAEVCEVGQNTITVRRFSTYCPKAFGIIGQLTPTLMDRAIEIAMQRKSGEKVERLRRRDNEDHSRLRQQCLRFAEDNRAVLTASEPTQPENLNDRVNDFWEPLFAIANHAGGHWPKLAMDAALALSGEEAETEEKSVALLADIKRVFDECGHCEGSGKIDEIDCGYCHGSGIRAEPEHPAITTKKLVVALCSDEERPWATWNKNKDPITERQLGGLLRPFRKLGVISETVHPHETGELKAAKGYRRARLEDAFKKYLSRSKARAPGNGTFDPFERSNADEMGTSNDFSIRSEKDLNGGEKGEKSANDGGLHARTDREVKTGHERLSGHGNNGFRSDIDAACEELRERGED